ncbi:MAG TPA: hypothetical protein VED41_11800, partial [Solirubrobacteraceae bacterium]|nr:hypothetical protein [Solirubrobacteraceae bacterium]
MLHLAYIDPGSLYTVSSGLAAIVAAALSVLTMVLVYFRRIARFLARRWRVVVPVVVVIAGIATFVLMFTANRSKAQMASSTSKKRMFIVG